jgi:myosin heavy subunit
MNSNKSNRGLSTILWVLLGASIIGNAYLLMDRSKMSDQVQQQVDKITESEQLNAELEKQYYEALSDLEEMRGSNDELNTMIETQKEELKQQKNKIASLIKNGKDLKSARAELVILKSQAAEYVAQIETLRSENEKLSEINLTLEKEKGDLSVQVEESTQMNNELTTAKAALISEKEILSKENEDLAAKVNVASVINVSNITIKGIKLRDNGKERAKNKANKINHLKVCFDLEDNNVAEAGIEQFFIRILNPDGETMTFENFGSGIMVESESGKQIRYTLIKGVQYNNDAANTCFDWAPEIEWASGEYGLQVFNKGFLVGESAFALK